MVLVMSVILNEQGSGGSNIGVVASLSIAGVSGTTTGIGTMVILMGRVLAMESRQQRVLEWPAGRIALAVMPGDVRISADGLGPGDVELEGVLDALLLANLEDHRDIEDALESLTDWIEYAGYDTDSDSIGGYDAVILSLDQFDEEAVEDYAAGYVITGSWLALDSSEDSLESFHDAAEGEAGSLDSVERYADLMAMAPVPLHLLMYADAVGIVEMVVDGLDEDSLEDYEDNVQPFVEKLDAFTVAGSLTGERWHFTAAVTLRQ